MNKAKEYLKQAYRLDQRIKLDLDDVQYLRELASSVQAVKYDSIGVQTAHGNDARFVQVQNKIWDLEEKISKEAQLLASLKEQIRMTIEAVPDTDERLVLHYRYEKNMTWEEIGEELCADRTTVYRWHGKALQNVVLPHDPIWLK